MKKSFKNNWKMWVALFMTLVMVVSSGLVATNSLLNADAENSTDTAITVESTDANANANTTQEEGAAIVINDDEALPGQEGGSTESAEGIPADFVEGGEENGGEGEDDVTDTTETPEQTTITGQIGGISVTIQGADAAFGEPVTMELSSVSADDALAYAIAAGMAAGLEEGQEFKLKDFAGVDFVFRNADGDAVEPSQAVTVTLTFDTPLDVTEDDAGRYHLLHFYTLEDGTKVAFEEGFSLDSMSSGEITFTTMEFSGYLAAVAAAPETPVDPVKKELTVTATSVLKDSQGAAKSGNAVEGDKVEYTITVTNTGDADLTNIFVTADMDNDGIVVYSPSTKGFNLAQGETRTMTGTYDVTLEDQFAYKNQPIYNNVKAEAEDGTTGTAKDGGFTPGPKQYQYTVTVGSNITIQDNDIDRNNWSVSDSSIATLDWQQNKSVRVTGKTAGLVTVTHTGHGGSKNTFTVRVLPKANEMITVSKAFSDASQKAAELVAGDVIYYDIIVRNDSDDALTDITVSDNLSGAEIIAGVGYSINAHGQAIIASVLPTKLYTIKAKYTVTQADVTAGRVISNTASASYTYNNNNYTRTTEAVKAYCQGASYYYVYCYMRIKDFSTELKQALKINTLVANDADYAPVGVLKVSAAFFADCPNGWNNNNTIVGLLEDADDYDRLFESVISFTPGYIRDTGGYNYSQNNGCEGITLDLLRLAHQDYKQSSNSGKTALFRQTNETYGTNEYVNPDTGNAIPNSSHEFHYDLTYDTVKLTFKNYDNENVITDATNKRLENLDRVKGSLVEEPTLANNQVAEYYHQDKTTPFNFKTDRIYSTTTIYVKYVTAKPRVEVSKKITSTPQYDNEYKVGDTVTFEITVSNTGNVDLTNIEVSDILTGAAIKTGTGYTVDNGKATVTSLKKGESVKIPVEYTIQEADRGRTFKNYAVAKGPNNTPNDTGYSEFIPVVGPKRNITITAQSKSKTYDGTALTHNYISVSGNLKAGDKVIANVSGSQTDAGTSANTITSVTIKRGTRDVTDEYNVTTKPGTLTVTKKIVNIESADLSKTYDGTALTNGTTALAKNTGWVGNDGADVTFKGTQTLVGSSANSFTYTLKAGTKEDNYDIRLKFGTLTVTDNNVDPDKVINKTKTGWTGVDDKNEYKLGETIGWKVVVKNIYAVAKDIQIIEQAGVSIVSTDPAGHTNGQFLKVAPGAEVTAYVTHVVTEDDIKTTDPNHKYPNTVKAKFDSKEYPTTNEEAKLDEPDPKLTISKTADKTTGLTAGETVTYKIVVENKGNVTVTGINVTDTMTGIAAGSDLANGFDLAPGEKKEMTAAFKYAITQADIDAGTDKVNTASAKGKYGTQDVTAGPASQTVKLTAKSPALTSSKSVDKITNSDGTVTKAKVTEAGDKITYRVTVTNSGNVTMDNFTLADAKAPNGGAGAVFKNASGTVTSLAPGQSAYTTYEYTVTQADVNAGKVENSAVVTGDDPDDNPETPDNPATHKEDIDADPELTVTKTEDTSKRPTAGYKKGDTITWNITVTNTGNVTVTDVKIKDDMTGNGSGFLGIIGNNMITVGTLEPGQTSTAQTVTYTVQESDIVNGSVVNKATAQGTPARGTLEVIPGTSTVPVTQAAPSISAAKTAAGGKLEKVGDKVTYKVTITNNGNVTVGTLGITDAKIPAGTTITWKDSADNSTVTEIAPGKSAYVTYTYTVTQADLDAGSIYNKATVTAKGKDKDETSLTKDAEYTIDTTTHGDDPDDPPHIKKSPALDVTKTAVVVGHESDTTYKAKANDVISYTITIENKGNVTLNNIKVTDTLSGTAAAAVITKTGTNWPNNDTIASLAPTGKVTLTGTYKVTQADVDAGGPVVNKATATDGNGGGNTTDDGEVPTPLSKEGKLKVEKTANKTTGLQKDNLITYTIKVTNTGDVTVKNITVSDPMSGLTKSGNWSAFDLAPGSYKELKATYSVTLADINSGADITNKATATGTNPLDPTTPVTANDSETVKPEAQTPEVTVVKTAASSTGSLTAAKAGDVITYTVTATNSGNVTLHDVKLTDPMNTSAALSASTLDPGAQATATYTYTVTQADVDAQTDIVNTATVNAKDPKDNPITPGTDTEEVTPSASKSVSVDKKLADGQASTGLKAGDTVKYVITITNNGDVTLNAGEVTVTDALTGLNTTNTTSLAPKATESFNTSYTITQGDVDAGTAINNIAYGKIGTGTDEPSPKVPVYPSTDKSVSVAKALKAGQKDKDLVAGDTVDYVITITNTGDVTLGIGDVTVTDPLTGLNTTNKTSLAPKATETFETTYTITQADVDAGQQVVNYAYGKVPGQNEGTPSGPVPVDPSSVKGVTVAKKVTSSKTTGLVKGDRVDYQITITNNGAKTLAKGEVQVTDPLTGLNTSNTKELAPKATETFNTYYIVTQADVDKGANIVNIAYGKVPGQTDPTPSPEVPVTPSTKKEVSVAKALAQGQASTGLKADDVVNYVITITNTGDVSLNAGDVAVADAKTGLNTTNKTKLAPGGTETFTTSYTITQADVDAGQPIKNVATGKVPGQTTPTESPEVSVDPSNTKSIEVKKSATVKSGTGTLNAAKVGDVIEYTVTAKNTGDVTLKNVTLSDSMYKNVSLDKSELAPGAKATATYTYTITQADIDAQADIVNVATVTAKENPTDTQNTASDSDTVTVKPETKDPKVSVVKSATSKRGNEAANISAAEAGDVITYTVTVTNIGNVKLTGVTLADDKYPSAKLDKTDLNPGDVASATYTYTITQADIDAQAKIKNVATITGKDPQNEDIPTVTDDVTVTPVEDNPAITVVKSATTTGDSLSAAKKGDKITYTVTVTNNGNVKLTNVTLSDSMYKNVSLDKSTLNPGDVATATYTYTITQTDIDNQAVITNIATVNAKDPQGTALDPVTDSVTVTPESKAPGVTVDKSAASTGDLTAAKAGDVITYTVTAENTGNVKLTGVTLTDSKFSGVTLDKSELNPGDKATATYTYTITQGDIDAQAKIVNVATVTAEDPQKQPITPGTDDETVKPETKTPGVTVVKSATIASTKGGTLSAAKVGDVITYTVTVTNSGNVKLTNVTLADNKFPDEALDKSELNPGDVARASYTYTITQADIDNQNALVNVATVTGKDPQGTDITPGTSSVTVTPEPKAPGVTVTKDAVTDGESLTAAKAGDTITYTVTAENTGNVKLTGVTLDDNKYPSAKLDKTELNPGDKAYATYTYTITQTDIDAQADIVNVATVTAEDPQKQPITPGSDNETVTPETKDPKVKVEKSATTSGTSLDAAKVGDVITYTVTVENTGNVKLTGVTLADDKYPSAKLDKTELNPGDVATATYTYTITQADVDAQAKIKNIATVTAKDPQDDPIKPTTDDETVTPISKDPKVTVRKEAKNTSTREGASISSAKAGDVIEYKVTVTNSGNVKLTNVTLTDDKYPSATLDKNELEPGDVATATYTYTIKQSDIDAQADIVNTATVDAKDSKNQPITPGTADETVTPETKNPGVTVSKTATSTGKLDEAKVGDVITYTVTAKNTGNVSLTNVTLADDKYPKATLDKSELKVGEVATATYTYTITQADIDAQTAIVNVATVDAKDPQGEDITPGTGTKTVTPETKTPSVKVEKKATSTGSLTAAKVGDVITYTVTVTNTGNVKLKAIALIDKMAPTGTVLKDTSNNTVTTLEPGAVAKATYTYTITQADIDAQDDIVNVAKVTADDPQDKPITPVTDDEKVEIEDKDAKISVKKIAEKDVEAADGTTKAKVTKAGDKITYKVTVKNEGNVTIDTLSLTDAKANANGAAVNWISADDNTTVVTALGPNKSAYYEYVHVVTQTEIDNGEIKNTAKVDGEDPQDKPVSGQDDDTIGTTPDKDRPNEPTIDRSAAISVAKTASRKVLDDNGNKVNADITAAGDEITYTVTVTNTGNVTVKTLQLTDTKAPAGTVFSPTEIGPGQTATATYTYKASLAEMNAGTISNTADVTGKDPKTNEDVTGSDSDTIGTQRDPNKPDEPIIDQQPKLSVTKTVTDDRLYKLGETITWNVTVTNTGNVTVKDISIVDDKTGNGLGLWGILGNNSIPAGSLDPGKSVTKQVTYTVTEADLRNTDNNGKIKNVATATGSTDGGKTPTVTPGESEVPLEQAKASIAVIKTADYVEIEKAGDTVTYRITVTNNGNQSVTLNKLDDAKAPQGGQGLDFYDNADSTKGNKVTKLAPGQKAYASYTYAATQADLDGEEIKNKATVTATPDGTTTPITNFGEYTVGTDPTKPHIKDDPKISVKKEAINATVVKKAGDVITYKVTVTNTGNQTIHDLKLNDDKAGTTALTVTTLGPKESTSVTYTYKVTQDDMDARSITNIATVTGKDPQNEEIKPGTDSVTVGTDNGGDPDKPIITPISSIDVEKKAVGGNAITKAGDKVKYEITVTNNGNQTIKGLTLADAKAPAGAVLNKTELKPGEKATATYEYTVTQAEMDKLQVYNKATITGTDPAGKKVDDYAEFTVDTTKKGTDPDDPPYIVKTLKLSVAKSATGGQITAAGQTIDYTVSITNNGNVTLSSFDLQDALAPNGGQNVKWYPTSIAPGKTAKATYTYTVTQADMDAEKITNIATVTGTDPTGETTSGTATLVVDENSNPNPGPGPGPGPGPDPVIVPNPHITVTKTVTDNRVYKAGETITWTITVKNDGNQTLYNVAAADKLAGVTLAAGQSYNIGTMKVGDSKTLTVSYVVTEADAKKGTVQNVATATGTNSNGDDPTVIPGTDDRPIETPKKSMVVNKVVTSTPANGTAYQVGEVINYRIDVSNNGNRDLVNVTVEDQLTGNTGNNVLKVGDLKVGETKSVAVTYTVTLADILAGTTLTNVATSKGNTPDGETVTPDNPGTETVPVNQEYTITIHYVDPNGNPVAPDTIQSFRPGQDVVIYSPVIPGYVPDNAYIATGVGGMPAMALEFTVTYSPIPVPDEGPAPEPEEIPTPGGEIVVDEGGNVNLIEIPADEVPKGNLLFGEGCNAHPFLIVLLIMIIVAIYTKSAKDQQKKILELQEEAEEYEEKLAKRNADNS